MRPIQPMLATLVSEPFHRPGWVYEEKYDGIRALAYRTSRRVRVYSRNQLELTAEFAAIAAALEKLPGGDFALDGEIVTLDSHGVSRFQLLQRRSGAAASRARYAIFDCLERDGVSLLRRPLDERRRELEALVPARAGVLMRSRRLRSDGLAAYRLAQQRGWEGILAKELASIYEPGRRSRAWLKVKVRKQSEFVIGGFTQPAGSRSHFGALLLGLFEGGGLTRRAAGEEGERRRTGVRRAKLDDAGGDGSSGRGALRYVGKVGAGFTQASLAELARRMRSLRRDASPFTSPSRERGATWVEPQLVAQIAFAEWTADDKLRQPVFLGLRDDKSASDCTWRTRER